MHSRIASWVLASPLEGRSSAKLRRSPLTEYCRAGNVTLRPPLRRSQTAKPTSLSPLNGPESASKTTSASASFPAGVLAVLGRIFTDTTAVLCLDMGSPWTPTIGNRRRGCVRADQADAAEQGGTCDPWGAHVVTENRLGLLDERSIAGESF